MNKRLITYFLLTFGLALSSQLVLRNIQTVSNNKAVTYISTTQDASIAEQQTILQKKKQKEFNLKEATTILALNFTSTNQVAKSTTSLSRGGTGLTKSQTKVANESAAEKKQTTYSSKVELLDWWKSGRTVFSIGTIAEVTDLYTGKTFKVKRTMGTNHADSEALTKKDSEKIKSIWGGFSWSRRPVILTINGNRYAASMSAMPHAGLDSASAYAVINNRSDGYGRGENLDVIKGNGMDGHFDIHFLNSTRHKDGQEDPEHQAAVLKATGK